LFYFYYRTVPCSTPGTVDFHFNGNFQKMHHWTTLITTTDYAEGVVCLAQSLVVVESQARLLCYVPNDSVAEAIRVAIVSSAGPPLDNLDISVLPPTLYDTSFSKDVARDASLFIDAPRRFLFLEGNPFIFLDSDMIATQNFDELLSYLEPEYWSTSNPLPDIVAVPNFRNKKKGYGDESGNFNAGMMIVPNPKIEDYNSMIRMLEEGYSDTEEKLLNEIFRNRWKALPVSYNCQKRAFKLAPAVWNFWRNGPMGIKIIHYVGGKPWQTPEEIRRLDWEGSSAASMAPYDALFRVWHVVRRAGVNTRTEATPAGTGTGAADGAAAGTSPGATQEQKQEQKQEEARGRLTVEELLRLIPEAV
jgi:hypothetical protein